MDNMIKCAKKGCYTDQRHYTENYIDLGLAPKMKLMKRMKKSESGKNESLHRVLNNLVNQVAPLKC